MAVTVSMTDPVVSADVRLLLNRQVEFEQRRMEWNTLWTGISDYFPRRPSGGARVNQREGKLLGELIFDGSPGAAAQILADGMQGYLASPSFDWFKVSFNPPQLNELPGARAYAQDVESHLYWVLRNSNFYSAMNQYFYDAATLGTATMYVEEDKARGKISFICLDPWNVWIAENRWCEIDTHMRKFRPTLRKIVQLFGDKKLPASIMDEYKSNPDAKREVIHWVYPRNDRDPWKVDRSNMPWASLYLLPYGSEQSRNGVILRESGYRTAPHKTWRWRVNSGETYARSPASDSFYDIEMLNSVGKAIGISAQKEAEPPLNVPEEMEGNVRMVPNGMNYYEDANRIITEVRTRSNPAPAMEVQRQIREIIERHFKVKYWLMLSESESKNMTATQVMEMAGEKAAVLGPNIGRLDAECLQPLFTRIYDIESEAGRLPTPPEALAESGGQLQITVMGPLAQAQRRLFQTQGILQSAEVLAPMVDLFGPSVLDIVNPDLSTRKLLESYGWPQDAFREKKEVTSIREQRAAALQAEQQTENLQGLAKAGKDMATPVPPGSPLEQAMAEMPA